MILWYYKSDDYYSFIIEHLHALILTSSVENLHLFFSLQPLMRIYEVPEDEFDSSGDSEGVSDGYQSDDKGSD